MPLISEEAFFYGGENRRCTGNDVVNFVCNT